MTDINDFLNNAASEMKSATADKLEIVRNAVVDLRTLTEQKKELELRLKELSYQIKELTEKSLVNLFSELQINELSLEADGNHPAITAKRVPFYSAKIPEEREAEAFNWFLDNGHGDLVKNNFNINFGMGEISLAQELADLLNSYDFDYDNKAQIHPSTLKAFVKSEIEAGHSIPMDLLGAYAGEVVQLKEKK